MKKLLLIFVLLFSFLNATELLKKESKLVANGKAVMFIFDSETCSYCDLLKKDFKTNKNLQEASKSFNIYLIDKEREEDFIVGEKEKKETTTTLRMAFAIKSTPNIIMFDKKWNKIFQLPGYASPKQMIIFMNFVKELDEGKYKIDDYEKYLRSKGIL